MTEYTPKPIPDASLGGWLVAFLPGWKTWDEAEPVDMVDVGWSADGARAGYRHVGNFSSLREADLALEAAGRRLSADDGTTGKDVLEAAGFVRPPPQGFVIPGMPYWEKEIDERWFVYFIHDEMNGTELKVVDRSVIPHRQIVVGMLRLPYEIFGKVPRRTPAIEEALLAILNARFEAGDPSTPLVGTEKEIT